MEFLPALTVLLILVASAYYVYRFEKKIWNNGVCRCGNPWEIYHEKHNQRAYACANEHFIWICYKVDKPRKGMS